MYEALVAALTIILVSVAICVTLFIVVGSCAFFVWRRRQRKTRKYKEAE